MISWKDKFKKPRRLTAAELELELWRPIPGWEQDYYVSNQGRIRRQRRKPKKPFIMKPHLFRHGVAVMTLHRGRKKTLIYVRAKVWEAFGDPTWKNVRYIDPLDPFNCSISNLRGVPADAKRSQAGRRRAPKVQGGLSSSPSKEPEQGHMEVPAGSTADGQVC